MTAIPEKRLVRLAKDNSDHLVEKAIQGSEIAFQELVLLHHQSVRIFVSRYIHCGSHVDDVAQEVFLAAFNRLSSFRGESKFSTWLLGIARNKALHFLRTESRRRISKQQFLEAEMLRCEIERLDKESDLQEHESRLAALRSCLEQLPFKSRLLIQRFYVDQLPSHEIAEQTNQKSGAIRMKLLRIRRILQNCISAKSNGTD